MTISVYIADDHGVLRAGLRALLRAEHDLRVVGEAADGLAALHDVPNLGPDVVLADISMPGISGIELAGELKRSGSLSRVLILTMHEDEGLVQEALRMGAYGYIIKRAVESELIEAIRAVAGGDIYVHQNLHSGQAKRVEPCADALQQLSEPLGGSEASVLRLLAQGYTGQQIADRLGVDLACAERLRAAVSSKLGLRSRIDLVRYARDHGFLDN